MTDQSHRGEAAGGGARRRHLAILFSDLSDSTRLAAAMETEDYADMLGDVRSACEQVIAKHGGTVLRIQGDGILACFGYPNAREDDGRRATEAALDLHDQVRGLHHRLNLPLAVPLHLHTGIHSGLVLLDEGDAVSGRMILFGNAVNVAARLCGAANSGEILVSRETLGAESHFFQTDAGDSLNLKGIDDPVAVYRIFGRTPVGTRFEARSKRGLTPLIGRQTELETLVAGLYDTINGVPRYFAVAAPAGLGKTRVAEEFLSHAATLGPQIHRGHCESYLSAEPLQPFLQILRSLCGLSYGISATLAAEALHRTLLEIDPALLPCQPVLLRALSLGASTKAENEAGKLAPETVVDAISQLFAALAKKNPLVLFIDDWQWADDATRQVLGAIKSLDRAAIFLLLATRESAPGNVGMSDAQIVTLEPFSVEEAERTIAHLLPGRNKFVVAEICGNAGGNPLFVEELCHSAAHDPLDRDGGGRAVGGKAWLEMLIEARVERLPPAQFELIRTAAVIGNVIPLRVLEAITGCGAAHPLIQALTGQDLIYPGEQSETLRFKHGITRDVIYESVGLRQRKAMHLRIADTLRQQVLSSGLEEEPVELLAYHYGAGGQSTAAAHYAELAGDKAMAASALDRAQVQYLAALGALDLTDASGGNYERWMQIAQRLALACVFDASREKLEVLLNAIELAAAHDDQKAMARAEYWAGYIYYALGESGLAIRYLEAARARGIRVGDELIAREIRAALGQARAAVGDYDRSIILLDEAIGARQQQKKSSRAALGFAYTVACRAAVLGDRGRFDEAYQSFDEALAIVRGARHEVEGSILCWRAGVSLWQGHWDEARRSAHEAQRVAERVKSLYLYAMSLSLGAYAAWMLQDNGAAALRTIVDGTSWLESRDRQLFISLNHGWLADGMVASRDWHGARRHAARAVMRDRSHDRIGAAMAYRAMARASAAGQNRKPAEFYLAHAMTNALARGSAHEVAVTRLCEAEIRLARGQRAQATALLDQAGAAFEQMKMTWHLEVSRGLLQDPTVPLHSAG